MTSFTALNLRGEEPVAPPPMAPPDRPDSIHWQGLPTGVKLPPSDFAAPAPRRTFPPPVPSGIPDPVRPALDPRARKWEDDVIYFMLTDRFHDGDPGNNFGV
ncbi:MAG: hypothetical protein AB1758_32440, partial [Candidatus Eremiobacterota bacterium]